MVINYANDANDTNIKKIEKTRKLEVAIFKCQYGESRNFKHLHVLRYLRHLRVL